MMMRLFLIQSGPNYLPTVPPAVRKLTDIEEINISSNNFLSDLRNLSNHIQLKSLKVKGCNVKDISCLMSLSNLLYLDISENDVSEIPKEIIDLAKLEYFNVKKNTKINTLPYELLKMANLSGESCDQTDTCFFSI